MIYFTFGEIWLAFLSFSLLGAGFALFRRGLLIFFENSVHIIKSASLVFVKPKLVAVGVRSEFEKGKALENNPLASHIFDFFFTLIMALGYILFSYVFLDGTSRLFSVFVMLVFFFAANKISFFTESFFTRFFRTLTLFAVLSFSVFLFPFKAILKVVFSLFRNKKA